MPLNLHDPVSERWISLSLNDDFGTVTFAVSNAGLTQHKTTLTQTCICLYDMPDFFARKDLSALDGNCSSAKKASSTGR